MLNNLLEKTSQILGIAAAGSGRARQRPSRGVLGVEMLALVVVYGLMAAELRSSVTVATVTQVILTTAGGLASILLFLRHRSQTISSNWNYAVMVIGFAGLVNFSLGNKL